MNKKLSLAIIISTTLFMLVGCMSKSPSNVVELYFTEMKKGKDANVSELIAGITSSDDENKETGNSEKMDEAFYIYNSKLDAKVLSEKKDKDKATVEVELTGLNMGEILGETIQEVIGESFASAFSGEEVSDDIMDNKMLEKVKAKEVSTRKGTISLTKVDNKWKIKNDDDLMLLIYGMNPSSDLNGK